MKSKQQIVNKGRRGLLLGGISAAVSLPILKSLTSEAGANKAYSLSYQRFYEVWATSHDETPSTYIRTLHLSHPQASASSIVELEFSKGNTTNIDGLIISQYEHATLAVLGQA